MSLCLWLENLQICIYPGPEKPPKAWPLPFLMSPSHTHMHTRHCVHVYVFCNIKLHDFTYFPLTSPPPSHRVGILLHIIKEVQRGKVTTLKLIRDLRFLGPHCLSNSIFAAEESRMLFWAATLVRAEWPYPARLFQPENMCICPLSTSIHGKWLPSSGQKEDDSYPWAQPRDKVRRWNLGNWK